MKRISICTFFSVAIIFMNACKTTKQPVVSNSTPESKENKNAPGGSIVLKSGQQITAITTTSSTADMGMEMKNTSTSTNLLNVISSDENSYTVSNTLTKFAMESSMMGQETSYDSEKPADKDNEVGKALSSKLNIADTVLINKLSGAITDSKKNSPERDEKAGDDNPLAGMMEMLSGSSKDVVLGGAILIIPKNKNTGDSWTDSSSEGKIKTLKTYTIKSIENDIASIEVKGKMSGEGEIEMQGVQASFTMDTKNSGTITVNVKSSLVNKMTNDADVSMTMDVMGQSMPITSKVNSTVEYKY